MPVGPSVKGNRRHAPANAGEISLRKKPFRDRERTVDEEGPLTPTLNCTGGPVTTDEAATAKDVSANG